MTNAIDSEACLRRRNHKEIGKPLIRKTTTGRVAGFIDKKNTQAWLGIPYAAPPVGKLRWRAPRTLSPWTNVRSAMAFGAPCAQIGSILSGTSRSTWNLPVGSEDCLYLNLWAPRCESSAAPHCGDQIPVMVWIHGGNNCAGTAATYPYLRNFAADHGVLVISVNYRLGLFGWFYHPALHDGESTQEDRSGNFGTLDLIAALRWVQANVAAFGGDPENVTIFGESAGGINVYSLIASPLAKGLFHKAIVQSGFPASFSLTEAFNFTEDPDPGYPGSALETVTELMIRDGIVPSRVDAKAVLLNRGREWTEQYLRKKSVKELLAPYKAVQLGMYNGPRIFRDGFVMPHETFTELGKQTPPRYNNVPVILGSNRDEFKLFMSQDPAFVRMFLGFIPRIRNQAAYRFAGRHASDAWKAVGVDEPARLLRAAQNSPVFAYRWDWDEEPNLCIVDLSILLGAGHGLEIPMLFNNFDLGLLRLLYARADLGGLRELAAAMGSYWTQFARAGSPGRGNDGMLPDWRPWDEGGRMRESLLILDTRNDGGIRMSCESVSLEGVLKSLAKEAKPGGCLDKRSQVGVAKLLQLFEQQFANAPLVSYTTSQKIC